MCSCCCHLSPAATPPHTAATPPQTASTPPQTAPQTAVTPPQAVQPGLQAAGQGATEVRVQEAVPGQDSQSAVPDHRHGKRQFFYTSKDLAKTILPKIGA